MKIRELHVRNFRSLKELSLTNIGDLSVFIGENSSGKSNIIDSLRLFFNEFDPAPQRNTGSIPDFVWYERQAENPVEFRLVFEVGAFELLNLLPTELTSAIRSLPSTATIDPHRLEVTRRIVGPATSASWVTHSVKLDDGLIADFDELVPSPKRILLEKKAKKLFEVSIAQQGQLLQALSVILRGRFKVILAARNTVGSASRLGDRISFMQQSTESELVAHGQSMERDHQEKWGKVEDFVASVSPDIQDLRVVASQITVKERGSNVRFPISLMGGGHQELFALAHEFGDQEIIALGLEEPEQHLHPELARQLFDTIKDLSKERQIFVTTHSTAFVDRADLGNTWIVRKEKRQTKAVRLENADDLRRIALEMGIRPSDIFFADGIIFVEGQTEKVLYPPLAKLIGIDLNELDLSIIPTHGKASGKYHLKLWIDASKAAQIPYFMILDRGAEPETKKHVKDGFLVPNENLFIMKKGSTEDYYPIDKLVASLREEFGIELTKQQYEEISTIPRTDSLENLLRSSGKDSRGWKVSLARRISGLMTIDDVDDELKSMFERVQSRVRTFFMGK